MLVLLMLLMNSDAAAQTKWKLNTNLPGGDFMSIDMATSDPTRCKAACDKDSRCKSWTLVKPEAPGGMGYCWLKDSIPPEIAEDCCISGLKGTTTTGTVQPPTTTTTTTTWKLNTNLPGGDFLSIDMATSDPARCKAACDKDSRCKCWTLVKPESPGGMGYCWLKDSIPPEIAEDCCISGIKGATTTGTVQPPTTTPKWKLNTNLPGGDFMSIDMATSNPTRCKAACDKDSRCKSWTLVKPEEPGGMGYCWLKDSVPPAIQEACCISGIKQ